jgi:[amino group carrier protein]-L-2-aminoadipate 6-kinase
MIILKIGGGESINIRGIIADLAEIKEQVMIVHGANALRDSLLVRLGIGKKVLTSVSGYSSVYTDTEALDVLIMTYAGLRNKRIVELCQQHGINAVGLSGIDGKAIQGKRNAGIKTYENGKLKLVRDLSGKPQAVNKELLNLLLNHGYTPVLSVPLIDENNFAINSENDDIVNVLQQTFQAGKIIQFIEAAGFLEDEKDPASLLQSISHSELKRREEQVSGRMKRKMLALTRLFESGATQVIICDGRRERPLIDALNGEGTVIQ